MTIDYDQNWRMNICPFGPSQNLLLAAESLGEDMATLDLNKLQLLPHGEKPGRAPCKGIEWSSAFSRHFLAGILILNLTRCYIL